MNKENLKLLFSMPVIVAALGYFVDLYDLIIFGIVRTQSLTELGLDTQGVAEVGKEILNIQMIGMLLGGILWGVLGDKIGRMKTLFATIILYSTATFATGFVNSITAYEVLRFIAGVGLAGELGVGITLISEILPKHLRGMGAAITLSIGVLGAVAANLIGHFFDWRVAYIVGGILGFLLLFLRIRVHESEIFNKQDESVIKGSFLALFANRKIFFRYFGAICLGIPLWTTIGLLIFFSPEMAKWLHIQGNINAGNAVMISYIALSIGGIAIGALSQYYKSRKRAVWIFLALLIFGYALYFNADGASAVYFYSVIALLGFTAGYSAAFTQMAAEQFGSNLRATVATTALNFIRGYIVIATLMVDFLKPSLGVLSAVAVVTFGSWFIAAYSLWKMKETFSDDLDFVEPI
ncbi:MAG: hypothetical protein RL154_1664 [Pseudomonadota bacterium]|jgi:MFS family permease